MINKNRNREDYSFANINLLGNCNADCYFCLGKDIECELEGKNQLNTPPWEWKNFTKFLDLCEDKGIEKLYITGQTADGLQLPLNFLTGLVGGLQFYGFKVGVRTNGYLAVQKMKSIQLMNGGIGYSIHSLDRETNHKIMGRYDMPDWDVIIPQSGPNVRISIVVNRYNIDEIENIVKYCSKFPNVRYIQLRRISTDTRLEELADDIILYEQFYKKFREEHGEPFGEFFLAQQYMWHGKEVNFWRTVETSCNSINYFTDGTISDEYFIVEGYLKNNNND
jgi:MoaA/NifB/PqqE/SkfB family radical SAM enzyme